MIKSLIIHFKSKKKTTNNKSDMIKTVCDIYEFFFLSFVRPSTNVLIIRKCSKSKKNERKKSTHFKEAYKMWQDWLLFTKIFFSSFSTSSSSLKHLNLPHSFIQHNIEKLKNYITTTTITEFRNLIAQI